MHTIYRGFMFFYGGVLDLTLNKFRMELQGLLGGGGRSSMASNYDVEAGFMDLFIYSLCGLTYSY